MQVRREQIKELLRNQGVQEERLNVETDKIYELADIFFDIWLKNKEQKNV